MKGARRQWVAIVTTVALLICIIPTTVYADVKETEEKLNQAKEEKEKTEEALGQAEAELTGLKATTEGLMGQLNNLNNELTQVSENLAKLEKQIAQKQTEIEKTGEELEAAKAVEEEQYAAMKKRIQFMYEKKDYLELEMYFGVGGFSGLLNKADYIEKLSAYDRKQLTLYQQTRSLIAEKEAALMSEKKELDSFKIEVEAQQSRVAGLVSQTSGQISNYENEIAKTEEEMLAYEKQIQEQQDNIEALQRQLAEEKRLSSLAKQSSWRDISEVEFADGDKYLLANLIYCEAGNQPYEGQVAVGAVVMNRVMSSVFPDTVVGVIYQNKQFSPVASGRLALALAEDHATPACYKAAEEAMNGITTVGDCLFFRTPIEGLTGLQIGGHIFY